MIWVTQLGGPGLEAVAPPLPGPACREASKAFQGSPWWAKFLSVSLGIDTCIPPGKGLASLRTRPDRGTSVPHVAVLVRWG